MTSRDFCYWLQGYLEISESGAGKHPLNKEQMACVKKHLAMVFKHEIDPSHGDKKKQDVLNAIHNRPPSGEVIMRC